MTQSEFYLCRKSLLSILCVFFYVSIVAYAQSGAQDKDLQIQNVTFKNASLKAAIATLGKQFGTQFVFDETLKDSRISLELKDVTLKAATKIILDEHHLQARLTAEKTVIVFPDTESNRQRYEQYKVWPDKTDKKQ